MSAPSIGEIVEGVARRAGLTSNHLFFGTGRGVADARRAAFFVANRRGYSSTEIAAYFQMDEGTVRASLGRLETLLAALVSEGDL